MSDSFAKSLSRFTIRGHTGHVDPVAFGPDGQWIASGSWDGTVRLWDARTGGGCAVLRHPGIVRSLAFSPDSSWLVSGGDGDDRLRLWDVATGTCRKEIHGPGARILSVAVSPDGTQSPPWIGARTWASGKWRPANKSLAYDWAERAR